MPINPLNLEDRINLVSTVDSPGEKGRRYESFKQWEIYQDRIKDYVINDLREQYDLASVKEIPIVSSVNLSKRIVNQLSVVYKNAPERDWTDLSEQQVETVQKIYKDMRVNKKLGMSNRGYKLQDQSHLWVVPKNGQLILRVLKNHQITVIPDPQDPEEAMAYIISSLSHDDFVDQDNDFTATGFKSKVDQFETSQEFDEKIGQMEYGGKQNLIVWTKDFNWSMTPKGDVVGDINPNPLAEFGLMPFVDIAWEKEFEYWVRQGTGSTDFTVEFNSRLSEFFQVVKMQGFSQAVLKGPAELLTSNVRVGPNYLLKILTDPREGIDGDFDFANPGSDISGSMAALESLLSLYLSSQGIDPNTITAKGESTSYNSGLERLLAMIERITASAEDFDVYRRSEEKLWELIKAWLIVLNDTDGLKDEYKLGTFNQESEVRVKYKKPEMIQSENEYLDGAIKRIELGISSPVKEIMMREDVSREDAEELYDSYQKDNMRGIDAEERFGDNPREDDSES